MNRFHYQDAPDIDFLRLSEPVIDIDPELPLIKKEVKEQEEDKRTESFT